MSAVSLADNFRISAHTIPMRSNPTRNPGDCSLRSKSFIFNIYTRRECNFFICHTCKFENNNYFIFNTY